MLLIGVMNFTMTQLIHDAIPSFIFKYLAERYNDNLIRPPKLTLDENLRVMKELILIQKKTLLKK